MKVFHPQISLRLIKIVDRTSGSFIEGADGHATNKPAGGTAFSGRTKKVINEINLVPYLGERGGVKTSKSVREPYGSFSIVLTDQPHPGTLDTLYSSIEPMDMVEIRFCHDSTKMREKKPPIIMRGFVSDVRRDETMGNDGKPMRSVTISGHDYGKIWEILRIYYLNIGTLAEGLLPEYKFMAKYGQGAFSTLSPAGQFLDAYVANVLTPYLKRMTVAATFANDGVVKGFTLKSSVAGTVNPWLLSNFQEGSAYQQLLSVLDVGAFNELYIEDTETSVDIVFRPAPAKNLADDSFIQAGASTGPSVDVSDDDIQALSVSRSDAGTANHFWIDVTMWNVMKDVDYRNMVANADSNKILKFEYENSRLDTYGYRKMTEKMSLGPPNDTKSGVGTEKEKELEVLTSFDYKYLDQKLVTLGEINKDNVVFESGTMKLCGDEAIKPGIYLNVTRGKAQHTCYAHRVEHEFMPFQGFWTTVTFDRGTGFAKRGQNPISPYWSEMNVGGIK